MALSGPVYITPRDLLQRAPLGAIPRSDIPGPAYCGRIGPVTHVGASTGVVRVTGYPVDAVPMVVKCTKSGDVGTAEFAFSDDGGVTFGDPVISDPNAYANSRWDWEVTWTGLIVSVSPPDPLVSPGFIFGDTWTVTPTASPRLLQICGALSDYFRKWAFNTSQKVDEIDEADADMLCEWGRWKLVAGRGDVPEDWKEMARIAQEHFKLESIGDLNLNSKPDPNDFTFGDIQTNRVPFSGTWRW